jgi:hypothetical protein
MGICRFQHISRFDNRNMFSLTVPIRKYFHNCTVRYVSESVMVPISWSDNDDAAALLKLRLAFERGGMSIKHCTALPSVSGSQCTIGLETRTKRNGTWVSPTELRGKHKQTALPKPATPLCQYTQALHVLVVSFSNSPIRPSP